MLTKLKAPQTSMVRTSDAPYELLPPGSHEIKESVLAFSVDQEGAENAEMQIHFAAPMVVDLWPLLCSLADGKISGQEVLEVAEGLSLIQKNKIGKVSIILVESLRKSLADGKLTPMEALMTLFSVLGKM